MFDCPEHNQMSPTRMLLTVTLVVPATVIV